ncbi:MAG: peptide chain release factor N(5)-glutamine methyltransferase [Terrimicrobiaceae bacterium]|nr:peptide chain release factor N(5)-glutamine methyltransferase [Terrimicrobiaceae bacterium]
MSVLEVLRGATAYLGKKGVSEARLNAELLLAHVLKTRRLDLYLAFDRPLSEAERAPMRELVRARGEGRPLQHLIGSVEFLGREFLCDPRALIPRPETEQLAAHLLEILPGGPLVAADSGTGSGVLAITLALERPSWNVLAADISAEALDLARENARRLGAQVAFFEADLLPPQGAPFDLVVANLPYIPTGDLPRLPREVRADPAAALDGGEDGLRLIARLIPAAARALAPGGLLALEVGDGQAPAVRGLLEASNYRDIAMLPDYQGIMRFLTARHG